MFSINISVTIFNIETNADPNKITQKKLYFSNLNNFCLYFSGMKAATIVNIEWNIIKMNSFALLNFKKLEFEIS